MSHAATPGAPAPAGAHRLALDYQLSEDVALDGEGWTRHVERWTVTVTGGDGGPVGYAHVIILNLGADVEVADLTDAVSGEWREPVARITAGAGRDPSDAATGTAGALGAHVLVLDRVFIEPARRGSGLGPIVAALVVGRLRRGCRMAVCFPAPFDGPHPDDERDRSITALGRIWATVGFRPRPDGVWVLNLEDDTLGRATDELLARASGPVPPG